MRKLHRITRIESVLLCVVLLCVPLRVFAAGSSQTQTDSAPILITEVQPGGPTASDEFIELYNQSTSTIDLAAGQWQLQIASSKATAWDGAKNVTLSGSLLPGGYYLLTSKYTSSGQTVQYLAGSAQQSFSAGLTATSGHIRLTYAVSSQTSVADEVEWSTLISGVLTSPSIGGRSVLQLPDAIPLGSSIKRFVDPQGVFADTNDDNADFRVTLCATPNNTQGSTVTTTLSPVFSATEVQSQHCMADEPSTARTSGGDLGDGLDTSTDSPPSTVVTPVDEPTGPSSAATATSSASIPGSDSGLKAPQISEVLPNPLTPQTDDADEFIELYNSNATAFDLSGFQLEVGLTAKHDFTFPVGTMMDAHSFKAFFSSQTHLSMSNSGGQVWLLDPASTTIGQSDPYATAKDGQAWALADGTWQWTVTPTPNAVNVITAGVAKTKATTTAAAKATSKTPKTTAVATAKKTAKSTATAAKLTAATTPSTSLHPAVLAVVAIFALLYGAYEYRRDVANKLHQFRTYRAARRSPGKSPEGG